MARCRIRQSAVEGGESDIDAGVRRSVPTFLQSTLTEKTLVSGYAPQHLGETFVIPFPNITALHCKFYLDTEPQA